MIPLSILDLSPITEGSDASQSFRNTLDLARNAERWGYNRYWGAGAMAKARWPPLSISI